MLSLKHFSNLLF